MSEEITSFDELLHALDHGACIVDANRLTRELLVRLREVAEEHGTGKGSITLKLSLEALKKGETNIAYSLKTEAPKVPTSRTTLYATAKGGLVDEDPRQTRLKMVDPGRKVPQRGDA